MVLTLPALASFGIRARHNGLGGSFGVVLPVWAQAGRTCEALAKPSISISCCSAEQRFCSVLWDDALWKSIGSIFLDRYDVDMKRYTPFGKSHRKKPEEGTRWQ